MKTFIVIAFSIILIYIISLISVIAMRLLPQETKTIIIGEIVVQAISGLLVGVLISLINPKQLKQ